MMLAVILAAGSGRRIQNFWTGPKGLIRLGDLTLVEEAIIRLRAVGVDRILIVTGYKANEYDMIILNWAGVEAIFNPRYSDSGSMYSLCCARPYVDSSFLLLDSDLIFELRALHALIKCNASDCVLISGPRGAGDEAYVQTREGLLVQASKCRPDLSSVDGELVGISKLSSQFLDIMIELTMSDALLPTTDYDFVGFVRAAAIEPLVCCKIEDLVWSEIDDQSQFNFARLIHAKLKPELENLMLQLGVRSRSRN
jgi:2-aminoethylphosphonate-pyruvate transaminase